MTMAGPDGMTFGERINMKKLKTACDKIENRYCPQCKRRFIRLTTNEICGKIFYKENRTRWSGVRCKNFKRMNDGLPKV